MTEKLKQKLKMWAVCGVLILAACVGVSKVVTVTNTVNGKKHVDMFTKILYNEYISFRLILLVKWRKL